jgi:hypothetical protein
LAQTPSPSLVFLTGWPHHHHHNNNTIPPPLCIIPHCCFTWRARNRATTAQFRVFDPNPPQKYLNIYIFFHYVNSYFWLSIFVVYIFNNNIKILDWNMNVQKTCHMTEYKLATLFT